jgi:hypothetical protein
MAESDTARTLQPFREASHTDWLHVPGGGRRRLSNTRPRLAAAQPLAPQVPQNPSAALPNERCFDL